MLCLCENVPLFNLMVNLKQLEVEQIRRQLVATSATFHLDGHEIVAGNYCNNRHTHWPEVFTYVSCNGIIISVLDKVPRELRQKCSSLCLHAHPNSWKSSPMFRQAWPRYKPSRALPDIFTTSRLEPGGSRWLWAAWYEEAPWTVKE